MADLPAAPVLRSRRSRGEAIAPIYHRRLQRDGWIKVQEGSFRMSRKVGFVAESPTVWEKESRDHQKTLITRFEGYLHNVRGDHYAFKYSVREGQRSPELEIDGASRADWDRSGRLVYTKGAQLFAGDASEPDAPARLIADLTAQKPEAIAAPDHARTW
jgi:hypothetical protein